MPNGRNEQGQFSGDDDTQLRTEFRREHISWRAMICRCYDETADAYEWYGKRGISVCERWHEFRNFIADMGRRPEDATLDRIDVNGNYEPSNCRWSTTKDQMRNKRNNHFYEYQGRRMILADWSEELGIPMAALRSRILRHGWSIEKAFTHQSGHSRKSFRMMTLNGKTQCATWWANELGIDRGVINARLRLGWSDEKTLTTPVRDKCPSQRELKKRQQEQPTDVL